MSIKKLKAVVIYLAVLSGAVLLLIIFVWVSVRRLRKAYRRRISKSAQALMSTKREIAFVKTELNSKERLLASARGTTRTLRARVDKLRLEIGNVVASGK